MGGGRFSAWLIGENSLVTECAAVLLDAGHTVRGIVSPEAGVRRWAAARGLAARDLGPDLAEVLRAEPFDYLFSVVNMRMLPAELLRLPRRLAVNFHDALLPAGAGVHAAAWAVADGASGHGVTWHVMTAEADAGDIVAQRGFDLPAGATSHQVNLECWRAGLESFRDLAGQFAAGTARCVPQDLGRRTYHGRADRPDSGFVISWKQPACRICALVRAGDFGPHRNAFGVAKFVVGPRGSCLLAWDASASQTPRPAAPGTVVDVSEAGITVAAVDGAVRLSRFASLDGTALTAREVSTRYGIGAGTVLPEAAAVLGPGFGAAERSAVRAEAFWVRRLTGMRSMRLPFTRAPGADPRRRSHPVPVPAWVGRSADPAVTLTAAVLAYLGEVSGESGFDAGLRVPAAGPLAQVVPLAAPEADADFGRYAAQVAARLAEARRHGTFLLDAAARYPELSGRALALPVVIDLTSATAKELPPGTELMVRISGRGGCVLVADESVVPAASAISLAGGLAAFLDALPAQGPHQAPLVSPAEHGWQAEACNATAAAYPRDVTVPELAAARARQHPGQVAVVAESGQLTYRELEERSGRLAAYLAARGAWPGNQGRGVPGTVD